MRTKLRKQVTRPITIFLFPLMGTFLLAYIVLLPNLQLPEDVFISQVQLITFLFTLNDKFSSVVDNMLCSFPKKIQFKTSHQRWTFAVFDKLYQKLTKRETQPRRFIQ